MTAESLFATVPSRDAAASAARPPPPGGTPLLRIDGVSLSFRGIRALKGVSLSVQAGEIYSIVGPNGAGKTSLANVISGRYRPDEGRVFFDGSDITGVKVHRRASLGLGRTFQNLALFPHMSTLDNIMVGRHQRMRNNVLTGGLYWLTGARGEEFAHRATVERIIEFLELEPYRRKPAGTLSYGLRKRIELARALALEPRLLLLDEPMAGMNQEEKEDTARFIVDCNVVLGITIVMIEHDMRVVADLSHRMMVLDFGSPVVEGDPAAALSHPEVRRAYLGHAAAGGGAA